LGRNSQSVTGAAFQLARFSHLPKSSYVPRNTLNAASLQRLRVVRHLHAKWYFAAISGGFAYKSGAKMLQASSLEDLVASRRSDHKQKASSAEKVTA
jgi:hypothetical protein